MRVLIACEFSGIVRDAFLARGHDAISCDLLPSEAPGPHLQCDVRSLDLSMYDLMIAHPPCTYLAISGMPYFNRPGRRELQEEALEFVRWLLEAPVAHIALENPVSVISTRIRKPDCIIHPWQFGNDDKKTTCLWLKDLPALIPTDVLEPQYWDGKKFTYTPHNHYEPPGPNRSKNRSRTYTGIAAAMATQWGTQPQARES